jgi:hypothetical protein
MSALSDYAEKLVLDWLMTTGAATRPTTWYLALYTVAPSDTGGGTEVTGAGYTRKASNYNAASSPAGTTSNSSVVSWTAAGGAYGTIVSVGIFDASTAGNLLWQGALSTPKTVNDGDTIQFSAGNLTLTLA